MYTVDLLPCDSDYKRSAIINGLTIRQFNHSARWAFQIDDVIIKVDSDYQFSQSRKEATFWETIRDHEDKEYFAEIVASGKTVCGEYFWVAMKKYELEAGQVTPQMTALLQSLVLRWKLADVAWKIDHIPENAKGFYNWGLVKQKPLIFDYGIIELPAQAPVSKA